MARRLSCLSQCYDCDLREVELLESSRWPTAAGPRSAKTAPPSASTPPSSTGCSLRIGGRAGRLDGAAGPIVVRVLEDCVGGRSTGPLFRNRDGTMTNVVDLLRLHPATTPGRRRLTVLSLAGPYSGTSCRHIPSPATFRHQQPVSYT